MSRWSPNNLVTPSPDERASFEALIAESEDSWVLHRFESIDDDRCSVLQQALENRFDQLFPNIGVADVSEVMIHGVLRLIEERFPSLGKSDILDSKPSYSAMGLRIDEGEGYLLDLSNYERGGYHNLKSGLLKCIQVTTPANTNLAAPGIITTISIHESPSGEKFTKRSVNGTYRKDLVFELDRPEVKNDKAKTAEIRDLLDIEYDRLKDMSPMEIEAQRQDPTPLELAEVLKLLYHPAIRRWDLT